MKYVLIVVLLLFIAFMAMMYQQYVIMVVKRYPRRPIHPDEVPEDDRGFGVQSYEGLQAVKDATQQPLEIDSYDGLKLKGTLFRLNPGTHKVAIGCHGFHAYGLIDMGRFCPLYRDLGYDFLIISERDHDESEGRYICFGYKERHDVVKWAEKIVEIYGEDVQIVLHGMSMGAATVLMASALKDLPVQVKAVIEDCGYANMFDESVYVLSKSMPAWAARLSLEIMCFYGKILAGCTLKDAAPVEVIPDSRIPALMIHGVTDSYVPFHNVELIDQAYGGPHRVFPVPGAGHAMSHVIDKDGYDREVTEFLNSTVK